MQDCSFVLKEDKKENRTENLCVAKVVNQRPRSIDYKRNEKGTER